MDRSTLPQWLAPAKSRQKPNSPYYVGLLPAVNDFRQQFARN
jgi:hypothetical protein